MIGEEAASLTAPPAGPVAAAIGVVVIGRNEGERLLRCLRSLLALAPAGIYVDSGSSDGSVAAAERLGFRTLALPASPPFTAARARNAGLDALAAARPDLAFAQMVDGDCEVQPGWVEAALETLAADPRLAAVCGRRRERHPERSIYNALTDAEWDTPVGDAAAFGGDVMIRLAAVREVGAYPGSMIAGEEPELAMRLRKAGWRIARIDAPMTLHDADLARFGQWWRRHGRGGHGFAELAWLHPDARWPDWPRTCRSIIAWGGAMPALLLLSLLAALLWSPWWLVASLALLASWPLKMVRIARAQRRAGRDPRLARWTGVLLMIGKFAELHGLLRFHANRLAGRRTRLIEYKGAQ